MLKIFYRSDANSVYEKQAEIESEVKSQSAIETRIKEWAKENEQTFDDGDEYAVLTSEDVLWTFTVSLSLTQA